MLALLAVSTILATASGLLRLDANEQTMEPLIRAEAETRDALATAMQRYESAADASASQPVAAQPGALGFSVLNEYVVLERLPLAPLAAGVSDLLPDYYRFNTHADYLQQRAGSIDNPLRLSTGSFDLAFVLVVLVPIIVIALSYDVMSREKELGVLALVGAQGVSLRRFIAAKMVVRASVIVATIIIVNLLAIAMVAMFYSLPSMLTVVMWISVATLYTLFWFGLAALTNAAGFSSATNGVVLANLWLLLVIVIPAVVNLVATNVYPAPSRVELTTELREASSEAEERATAAREQYFFDHPDLAAIAGDQEIFFREVARGEADIARSIQPQLGKFDEQAERQGEIVGWMKYLSPALLAEQAFAALAGSDREYHAQFKRAAFEYHATWRGFFVSRLEAGQFLSSSDWQNFPAFSWERPTTGASARVVMMPVLALAILSILMLVLALFKFRRYTPV